MHPILINQLEVCIVVLGVVYSEYTVYSVKIQVMWEKIYSDLRYFGSGKLHLYTYDTRYYVPTYSVLVPGTMGYDV